MLKIDKIKSFSELTRSNPVLELAESRTSSIIMLFPFYASFSPLLAVVEFMAMNGLLPGKVCWEIGMTGVSRLKMLIIEFLTTRVGLQKLRVFARVELINAVKLRWRLMPLKIEISGALGPGILSAP